MTIFNYDITGGFGVPEQFQSINPICFTMNVRPVPDPAAPDSFQARKSSPAYVYQDPLRQPSYEETRYRERKLDSRGYVGIEGGH